MQQFESEPGYADFMGDRHREVLTEHAWTIELASDPDLMPRVLRVLPAEMVENLERRLHEDKHSLTLSIRTDEDGDRHWKCLACGEQLLGERLVIDNGGWSDFMQHRLDLCRSCVTMAVAAFSIEHSYN